MEKITADEIGYLGSQKVYCTEPDFTFPVHTVIISDQDEIIQ